MNVIELVKEGLLANGFDGLYSPEACGCLASDLAPCGELPTDCQAGYKHIHSESGEWVVSKEKSPLSDDEISTILNN